MTGCTATLTVALVAECPHGDGWSADMPNEHREDCVLLSPPDGAGGRMRWFSVAPYTLTCDDPLHMHGGHPTSDHSYGRGTDDFVSWTDRAPGATPHTYPSVTDAEVDAATAAAQGPDNGQRSAIRRALEAAARVRAGDDR